MKHLVIVDGHHLLYRAYWAIPRTMKTSKGEQVNTTFGLASMLLQILRTEEPDSLLFCFDADEKTFRHLEYEDYKGGRAETPDDFYPQVPRALELVDAFGIKSVSGNLMEADDYACTYARRAEEAGDRVTIVTGDRDLFQLASESIRVSIPHKGYQMPEYMGPAEILKKYGVTPAQIPAYKGLVGDHSDNLAGVKGIGPKAAEALLQEYGTLEKIYDNLLSIKGSRRALLEAGKEQAFFCQRMAVLKCDIPLSVPMQELQFLDVDTDAVHSFFAKLEFTFVLKRFNALLETPFGQAHFRKGKDAVLTHVSGLAATALRSKAIQESTQLSLL
ncbi:hypothetical protein EXS65_04485 [Candidatus Peribacteria bacterium]|nr:hypothetical protein [Candidatus Peribacteria bacterium]